MVKEALLIVDMLRDFVEKGAVLEVPSARKIIPRIKKRVEEAREKGIPVIYICDAHREDDREFDIWPKHAVLGTKGSEIVEELKPQEGDFIVRKRRYSGFLGTDLELLLRELGEAAMRDYEVVVYADSVSALSEDDHKFALDQLKRVLKVKVVG